MEPTNADEVEDASFLAELDALEGAAARKKKLGRLIAEKQTEIREAKKSRRKGGDEFTGGRMPKEKQSEENKRQADLSRLQDGLLPEEQNRPPSPSNRDLLASAAAHPTDHAGGMRGRHQGRGAVGPDDAYDGGDDSDDVDHDDLDYTDDDEDDAAAEQENESKEDAPGKQKQRKTTNKVPLSAAQKTACKTFVKLVKGGKAARFKFEPEEASMKSTFSKMMYRLMAVVVWIPHMLWKKRGVPAKVSRIRLWRFA